MQNADGAIMLAALNTFCRIINLCKLLAPEHCVTYLYLLISPERINALAVVFY